MATLDCADFPVGRVRLATVARVVVGNFILLLGLLFCQTSGLAQVASTHSLPPMRLRGYGELSAKFMVNGSSTNGRFSSLAIACESVEKAGIVHAKFVSDLHLLGEVNDETLAVAGIQTAVFNIPRQGVMAAFRNGKTVTILASPTAEGLSKGLAIFKGKLASAEFLPRSKVPMFLDSWDKHGFRFYYRPFQQPKGVEWRNCDVLAVLPFQVNQQKHVVAVYVMTRDAVKPFPPETFRLKFTGVKGSRVEATDVLSGVPISLQVKSAGQDSIEVTLPIKDQPALITIQS